MKKIRVLQFPIANSYGGITHYALNNWYQMDKTKFQCDFATMSPSLSFADEIEKTGAKIFYLSRYPTQDEERFRKEFNAILDNGYDVVHLHTKQWKNYIVEDICKERGIKKIIVHSHSTQCDNNDYELRKRETEIHNRVKQQITLDMATDFWACSRVASDWLFGSQIPREKIKIMPNAINISKFIFNEDTRRKKRAELSIEDNVFVIGTVGRLCYEKNQELLIRAFEGAYGNNQNYKLVIVGTGPYLDYLNKLCYKLGIEKQVMLLGMRFDVNELYQAFDLFALSSRFEGLPITLIEAQCAGLKCLINNTITKEVEITNNCVWVDNNEGNWTNQLRANSKKKERLDTSKEIEIAGYSIEKQIKTIEDEYSLIGKC